MTGQTRPPEPQKPEIVLIVAMARNRVIGKEGALPWHLPEDLKRFRKLTMGHPIIMGRRTWDSIRRPLPGRRNIVITRNPDLKLDGAEAVASLGKALELVASAERVFVIGGEQIYRMALPIADKLELTLIEMDVEGDAAFPEFDPAGWVEAGSESFQTDDGRFDYAFITLKKS